jgi:hypothetical protein
VIAIQYLCQSGPTAGHWAEAPSAPTFSDSLSAARWCQDVYTSMDAICWAYAPDLRVVQDGRTVSTFYAVKRTPRVYA